MVHPTSLLALILPLCSAQLDNYAKKAGLKYFGTATDSPGQRERAGLESSYQTYDAILRDGDEFGQTTASNGQKWLFTEPKQGVFNFTEGDIVTSIAQKEGLLQRCHALVWHNQLAPWVGATNWTADALSAMIVNHITHVMEHYKGKCYAWDVVNEALNDNGTYRKSVFYDTLGEDYIKLAFRTAQKVDPDVKLYYNDYNIESPGSKATAAVGIVKMLKQEGINISGVGMQSHWAVGSSPTLEQTIAAMNSYAAEGVEVAMTELDVRIKLPVNETSLEAQKQAYKTAAGACVQVEACVGITIWDFYDPFSWVPVTFPGQGSPLLWFDNFTKHPAYYGIIEAFENKTTDQGCKGPKYRRSGGIFRKSVNIYD
ncbi:family 10 glycosyl hydrolase [Truncatella angustata]|uniref:Beta-xylanase n=1 Tax=Truncatella angustata TaxID=152316 RepID=A0A9P8UTQ3_9PEZI|nr:family 10 glycosyl hydrolase [Truncatella angustata]KAH6658151.1 family 10 glycosyl hydrolase [Truncatella angustata]KAH8198261.1 hypothetical protein TruAng_007559 [Truncatella angustata]